jgi:glycosyltransferase involved in cell wall biosynthesis
VPPHPSIALVHDYLTQRGGAERVVLSLTRAFPKAALYTSLYEPDTTFPEFSALDVRPLPLNRFAPLRRSHRLALPLLTPAFSRLCVDADVVICSSSGWAHGARTSGQKIVYCHSPAKWLYRPADYLGQRSGAGARLALRLLTPGLRRFDQRAARSADLYLANSTFIARQIVEVYGIHARVLPPPVGIDSTGPTEPVADLEPGFLLTVARLLPYKNVAQTVEAFRGRPRSRLVVVGEGPERNRLVAAAPPNVTLLGEIDDARLRWLYTNCRGLVAASREDFGLTPVEAAAFGKPVAALRWGGFHDTVQEGTTGVFFASADPALIAVAIDELEGRAWDLEAILRHAEDFGEERFIGEIRAIVSDMAEGLHTCATSTRISATKWQT